MDKRKDDNYRIIKNCLTIVKDLSEGKEFNSLDFAAKFGVSKRTVHRYIEVLREVGFKIEYDYKLKSYYLINNAEQFLKGDLNMKNYREEIKEELQQKTADLRQQLKQLEIVHEEKKEQKEAELDRLFDTIDEMEVSEDKKDELWDLEGQKIKNKYNAAGYQEEIEKIIELENKIADIKAVREFEVSHFEVKAIGYFQMNYDTFSFLYEEDHEIIDKKTGREYWHKNVFDGGDISGKKGLAAHFVDEVKDRYDDIDRENIKEIEQLIGQGIRMQKGEIIMKFMLRTQKIELPDILDSEEKFEELSLNSDQLIRNTGKEIENPEEVFVVIEGNEKLEDYQDISAVSARYKQNLKFHIKSAGDFHANPFEKIFTSKMYKVYKNDFTQELIIKKNDFIRKEKYHYESEYLDEVLKWAKREMKK